MDGRVTYGLLYISPFPLWAAASLLSSTILTLTVISYKVIFGHISVERMMAFISISPPAFPDAVILLSSPAVDSDIHGRLEGKLCDAAVANELHLTYTWVLHASEKCY